MSGKYSRAHWSQIEKRVRQAKFILDVKWKCFICGKRFQHNDCPHTVAENESVIQLVQSA